MAKSESAGNPLQRTTADPDLVVPIHRDPTTPKRRVNF